MIQQTSAKIFFVKTKTHQWSKSNVLMMHILDVHTDYPFKNLFPINPTVLAAMTEDMKTHSFDMVHPIVVWGGHNGVVVD